MDSNKQNVSPGQGQGDEDFPAIPSHELLRLIGRGSYGEVWLARNDLGAFRAVKIVFERTFRDKRPFERELAGVQKFEPVSRLHDGLVDILQVGHNQAGGYFYYVMELADDLQRGQAIVPGVYKPRTLARETSAAARLPMATCVELGLRLASALAFLHSKGLIHRDVKPSNVVFVNGVPKLADIGLVAEMSEARSYVGTEGFIPPEGPGSIQADIYSLGKVLYELSTGKDRHEYPELPTLLDETIHGKELVELNKVIVKACRTDPKDRYANAEQLVADLERLQRGERVKLRRSRRRHLVVSGQLAGVLLAALGILLLSGRIHPFGRATAAGHISPEQLLTPAAGLVSWWRADGNAADACGVNPGVLMGSTSFARGKSGQAFVLDGTNDYVQASDSPSLNPTEAITLTAWVAPTQMPFDAPFKDGGEIIGKDGTFSNRQYMISLDVRQVFSAHIGVWNKGLLQVYGGTRLVTNNWYHVVMTYDQKAIKLYVNGALDASRSWSGPIMTGPEPFRIGGGADDGAPPFHFGGLIDEVMLFNRALSEAEIQALYSFGENGQLPAAVRPPTATPEPRL
ncbi:MAG TPA: LamG-like jellyroll fold domain-containing protein [Verrucomicrobiae bacterium]|nr:LamG-like jellyroll fold domain-containing protein [Verrucomicrobiae bacterium]